MVWPTLVPGEFGPPGKHVIEAHDEGPGPVTLAVLCSGVEWARNGHARSSFSIRVPTIYPRSAMIGARIGWALGCAGTARAQSRFEQHGSGWRAPLEAMI